MSSAGQGTSVSAGDGLGHTPRSGGSGGPDPREYIELPHSKDSLFDDSLGDPIPDASHPSIECSAPFVYPKRDELEIMGMPGKVSYDVTLKGHILKVEIPRSLE
ncbi:uncharacterized protein PV07_12679 [Cladophialophora immunda]|uniref:Uncharacterized protein n=1 Tax=Cladophialophora immunda TaxID=569365 RepID=A0A0D1Z2Q0_9EURO|nr:uncharacterized protein PV07_12679 [Cladophialophora immunda]KIW21911.1 hypothetical protein PV07_12679 [Cladophialophora immunda]